MYTPYQEGIRFRTVVRIVLAVLIISILILYVAWQGRFLLTGPQVTFTTTPEVVQTERIVTLAGTAANIVRITLNGRDISTTPGGYFEEAIILENGYTISTITAFDRYGRSRAYEYRFVYTPAFAPAASSTPQRE